MRSVGYQFIKNNTCADFLMSSSILVKFLQQLTEQALINWQMQTQAGAFYECIFFFLKRIHSNSQFSTFFSFANSRVFNNALKNVNDLKFSQESRMYFSW